MRDFKQETISRVATMPIHRAATALSATTGISFRIRTATPNIIEWWYTENPSISGSIQY